MFGPGPSAGEGIDPTSGDACDGIGGSRHDAAAGEDGNGEEEDEDAFAHDTFGAKERTAPSK